MKKRYSPSPWVDMSTTQKIPKPISHKSSAIRMLYTSNYRTAVMDIFDPIVPNDDKGFSSRIAAAMIDYARDIAAKKLIVRINSPGGDVISSLAIFDLLRSSGLETEAEIYGIAASAATIVALGCNKIRMAEQAQWMVHEPSFEMIGDLSTLNRDLAWFAGVRDRIFDIYAEATGKTREQVLADHEHEVYYTLPEAMAYGWPITALAEDEPDNKTDADDDKDARDDRDDQEADDDHDDRADHDDHDAQDDSVDPADEKSPSGEEPDKEDTEENGRVRGARMNVGLLRMLGLRRDKKQPEKNLADKLATAQKELRAAQAEAAAARQLVARMQRDAQRQATALTSALNEKEHAVIAERGYDKPLPAPQASAPRESKKSQDLSGTYRMQGLAGVLRSL